MAQDSYRGNLASDNFPFLSSLKGQTVIVNKMDQDYELEVNTRNKLAKEKQIPEMYFGYNVMPTGQGFQSVGYDSRLPKASPATMNFDKALTLRDVSENKFLYSPAHGTNYVYDGINAAWKSISPTAIPNSNVVTIAYLNGRTFICYANTGVFEYDHTNQVFNVIVLGGLIQTNIKGITTSQNFLIAWDNFTVYRGQLSDITNFTPDFSLGSGSDNPQDKKGAIVACLNINNGFVIYTTKNAVGATANVSAQNPFIYKEVPNSAGINDIEQVAYLENLGYHYAWTQAGFMRVTKTTAEPVWPECTDFIAGGKFEEFDPVTWEPIEQILNAQLLVKMAVIGSRYVVVSHGVNAYNYALVFDLTLSRWGKLKIDHVACFDYFFPTIAVKGTDLLSWDQLSVLGWQDLGSTSWDELATRVNTQELAKQTFGFLQADGTVVTVDFQITQTTNDAVIMLGKYQEYRGHILALDEIWVQNTNDSTESIIDIRVLSSIDGANTNRITTPTLKTATDKFRLYKLRTRGVNHTVVIKGSFHLNTFMLYFHDDGRS